MRLIALYFRYKNIFNYIVIGIIGIGVDFGIFAILYNLININPLIANIISGTCSITNNFLLNAYFNFKKTDKLFRRFFSFFSIAVWGMLVTAVILFIFHTKLGYNANAVKFTSLIFIVLIQYILNKKISFSRR